MRQSDSPRPDRISHKGVDICWLACANPGYMLHENDKTICLCLHHLRELSSNRVPLDHKEWAKAAPPAGEENGGCWPWEPDPGAAFFEESIRLAKEA